jgi:sulfonate transport system substrate-binding protein
MKNQLVYLMAAALLFAAKASTFGGDTNASVIHTTAVAPVQHSGKRVAKLPLNEWTVVAAQKGWLQAEFAKYDTTTELVDTARMGNTGVEAALLDRGDLHFAQRMQYPSLQHKLNGLDCVIVWQSGDAPLRRNIIAVLKDSPINSVEDLKGKHLSSTRISCPYFSAFEILKNHGLEIDNDYKRGDVRFVNSISSAGQVSGFLAGKFEAISIHPGASAYTPLETQGLVKEISASIEGGYYVTGGGRTSYFVPREWANANPDLVKAFLTVYAKSRRWIVDNQDEAANIIARELREPKHVALYTIKDNSAYMVVAGQPSYDDAVNAINRFQKWAIENGDDFLKKKSLTDQQVRSFVDKRFFEGGEYFVYTGDKPAGVTTSNLQPPVSPDQPLVAQAGAK